MTLVSETLKKHILDELKKDSLSILNNVLSLELTKRELLNMSGEELDLVKSFVKEYYIEQYNRLPKSFEHFLSNKRYGEDCKVFVQIPLEELVKRGILTTSVEEGKTYWYLYGEKLDPKQYHRLYLKDQRTFRTLIEELGLAEFIDRFDIEPTPRDSLSIFTIKFGEAKHEVHYIPDENTIILATYTHIDGSNTKLPQNTSINISINVKNPKVEDLPRVENLVREIRSDVEEKVHRIVDWIKNSFENIVGEMKVKVSGKVIVKDFKFDTYTLLVKGKCDLDSNTSLEVEIQYSTQQTLNISVTQTIKSRHLITTLTDMDIGNTNITDSGRKYTIDINTKDKTVAIRFSKKYSVSLDLENLPNLSEVVDAFMNMKTALYNAIIKKLDNIKEEKVVLYSNNRSKDPNITVQDFLEFVGWREDQSVEEAILRIWMIKAIIDHICSRYIWRVDTIKPDIISILFSLTYLKGAPHDYVVNKVNTGFDYAVNLALRGRLRIKESGVYLDGKRFDINPTNNSFINSVLKTIKYISSNVNQDVNHKKIRTAIASRT
ncbi:MAG: hypothetical protein QW456_08570 [Ignisphaera sp.]